MPYKHFVHRFMRTEQNDIQDRRQAKGSVDGMMETPRQSSTHRLLQILPIEIKGGNFGRTKGLDEKQVRRIKSMERGECHRACNETWGIKTQGTKTKRGK